MAYHEFEFDSRQTEHEDAGELELAEEWESLEAAEELDETVEMELASRLLEIADENELDQFIGRLLKRAGRAAGQFLKTDAGGALGGILKGAVRKTLPAVGGAIGGYVGGQTGSQLGTQLASNAGHLFGLELEGLSEEDQEFEVARRLVRFSDAAAKNLLSAPVAVSPDEAAKSAAIEAAKRHAPGLIRADRDQGCPNCGTAPSGRWIRRGRHIIIVDAKGGRRSRRDS